MLRIGHRGNASLAVENSVDAFRSAMRNGADGIELDVRLTKDNVLVASHDPTAKRIFGIDKYICDLYFNEITTASGRYGPASIAELGKVLEFIKEDMPKIILFDVKEEAAVEPLIFLIKQNGLEGQSVIISFHKDIIRRSKSVERNIKTGLMKVLPMNGGVNYIAPERGGNRIITGVKNRLDRAYKVALLAPNRIVPWLRSDLLKDAKELGADYAMFWWGATTKSFVKKVHRNGLGVIVGVANSSKAAEKLEKKGVDGIVTDNAQLLGIGLER